MTLRWKLMRTLAERAARSGKCKVESEHGGTPPCVTESVWNRMIAKGLRRHGRVELCRVCRVRGSGERREAEGRRISEVERRQRDADSRRGRGCWAGQAASDHVRW